jgi:hypothetical protein
VNRRGLFPGLVLVAVGLYFLLARGLGWRGPGTILLFLGAVFFAISAARRFRGPLLPAGVLLGLGAGFLLRDPLARWLAPWAAILLGLGLGFLLVAAIDRAVGRRREPPPLVPGAVLVAVAAGSFLARWIPLHDAFARIEFLWPFLIVAAGLLLILGAARRRKV